MLTQTIISNAVVATAMALAAVCITKVVRRPQVAYILWLLVLLKLVTPPIVPLRVDWGWPTDHVAGRSPDRSTAATECLPLPTVIGSGDPTTTQPVVGRSPDNHVVGRSPDRPTTRTECLPLPAVIGSGDPTTTGRPQRIHWPSLLIPIWLFGTIFWLLLAARRTIRFRRILRRATPAAASLRQETRRLAEKFRLKTRPRVFVTEGRVPPLVWPIARRPIVLLPRTLLDELSPSEQTKLVAHELAHLRRGDHRIRVLELLILALWWWHPVAWWARRRLRQAEEQCCDAWVLWAFPGTAKSYANTLLKTIDFLSDFRPVMPPAACGFHNNSPTVRRFEMILREGMKHKASWRVRIALLVVAAAVLPIALIAGAGESGKNASPCESLEEVVEKIAEPPEDVVDPSEPKRRLMRYDGKDFTWWQQELHTELKAELRVEALKAMGAFGANGYGEEAAAGILRAMKVHDYYSSDPDEQKVCGAASMALDRVGTSAVKPLIAALQSKHKNTRRFAALTLRGLPPGKDILPLLVAATKNGDPRVREIAVSALWQYGAEAVPALVAATKDQHGLVRRHALQALRRIQPDPEVVMPTLIECLADEDRTVQQAAIEYVGQIGPRAKQAVPALIKAFSEEDGVDRVLVVRALGEIGPDAKDALPLIKEVAIPRMDEPLPKAARTAIMKITK